MKLTERDIAIIKFINSFGFCEMEQIERKFFLKKPRNYQILRRLVNSGFLRHKRIFFAHYGIYYATSKGAKFTDLPHLNRISLGLYNHQIAIIKVYLKLQVLYPDAHWVSERQLKHDKFSEGLGKIGHLSDGTLILPEGKQIAIEVEMSAKGKNRLHKILRGYAAQLVFQEIWYYCLPSVIPMLTAATQRVPFIKIFNLNEFLSC